eukprot:8345964-Pyramimonas_sp.AAC.1
MQFSGPPGVLAKKHKRPQFNEHLYDHIRSISLGFDADCEQVEQLAGVELSKAFFDMPDPMFYNTVYLGKDPTHAASRILRRPWMCGDLRIKDVIGKVVRQRTSIMQRIRNSTVMKERFMKEVRMHDYAGNH